MNGNLTRRKSIAAAKAKGKEQEEDGVMIVTGA